MSQPEFFTTLAIGFKLERISKEGKCEAAYTNKQVSVRLTHEGRSESV